MPNPRLPNEIKQARGTLNVTRDNDFVNITADDRIVKTPQPPEYFNKYALQEWQNVWTFLIQYKLAATVDLSLIAAYCQEMGNYHHATEQLTIGGHVITNPKGYKVINPSYYIGNKSLTTALKIAAEFGFTPASRSRIRATKPAHIERGGILDLLDD